MKGTAAAAHGLCHLSRSLQTTRRLDTLESEVLACRTGQSPPWVLFSDFELKSRRSNHVFQRFLSPSTTMYTTTGQHHGRVPVETWNAKFLEGLAATFIKTYFMHQRTHVDFL